MTSRDFEDRCCFREKHTNLVSNILILTLDSLKSHPLKTTINGMAMVWLKMIPLQKTGYW